MTNINDAEHDALLVRMAYPSELEQLDRKDLIHVRKWDYSIFYLVKNKRNDVEYGRGYVGVQDLDDRNEGLEISRVEQALAEHETDSDAYLCFEGLQ